MKLAKDKALEILDDCSDEFSLVKDTIHGNSRWSIRRALIMKENSTGKFYRTLYSIGATELQNEGPWEYSKEVEFHEVFPVEKTITIYE